MSNDTSAVSALAARPSFAEIATDAIAYWEPRRVVYNVVLASIVIGYFVANLPESRNMVTFPRVLSLFILAVLANVCYCAAYLADVFAQVSAFRPWWLQIRWLLFVIGTVFAAALTNVVALGFFMESFD